jgi:chaperone required for assembly of F1-ATPase
MRDRFAVPLRSTGGLAFVEQDASAIGALGAALSDRDAFFLAALCAAAALLGSLVIAFALAERRLTPDEAFDAANIERIYQAERWGWDDQASAKAAAERAELNQISRFLELLRT